MDKLSLGAPSSKANVSDIDRRRFLKTTAGAAAGIAGSLSAPYVNAQSGVTLRILNAETTAASQSALRDACNEYESKFGVKIVVDSTPISGGYAKSMAAINAGAPYDIATAGYIAHILQYAMAGHIVPLTDLVKKYSWGKQGTWSYKGENWFYPYDYNLVTVFYRKDLYQEPRFGRSNALAPATIRGSGARPFCGKTVELIRPKARIS